jgi:hypothetical protein
MMPQLVVANQGDQIGTIFAHCVAVCFQHFLKNNQNNQAAHNFGLLLLTVALPLCFGRKNPIDAVFVDLKLNTKKHLCGPKPTPNVCIVAFYIF